MNDITDRPCTLVQPRQQFVYEPPMRRNVVMCHSPVRLTRPNDESVRWFVDLFHLRTIKDCKAISDPVK